MLVPRFSIRSALVATTLVACGCLVQGLALRGHVWAWSVSIALASLLATALVHAGWFLLIWSLARLLHPGPEGQAGGTGRPDRRRRLLSAAAPIEGEQ